MTKKAIFFDFDGVICDSIRECFITSSIAYEKYTNKRKGSFFQEFKRYRKYVAPPGEYYVLQLIMNGEEICKSYGEFQSLVRKYSSECNEFRKYFFETRRDLIKTDEKAWIMMHSFYKEVINLIKNHDSSFFIITTKNDEAVYKLMEHAKIANRICGVCSVKASGNKRDAILRNMKTHNLDDVMFIDDHPMHAANVSGLKNVKTYLADWGYWNGDAREFENIHIAVLKLKELQKTVLSFFKGELRNDQI